MRTRPRTKLREERVVTVDDLELRTDGDGQPVHIVGHPIVYNTWSQDLGGFRERVLPGSATKTLLEGDARSLFNHDPNFILGRVSAGTLTLKDEAKGLHMDAVPPDTQMIRDLVLEPMRRGDLTQMSFAFRTIADEWRSPDEARKKDGLWERDVSEFQLYDVSPVTFPAYTQTDVGLRSIVEGAGIDFSALSALMIRAERGVPLNDSDLDLVNGSIHVLRSYLPGEPEPDEGDHSTEPQAGRSIVHLQRLLAVRERELLPV